MRSSRTRRRDCRSKFSRCARRPTHSFPKRSIESAAALTYVPSTDLTAGTFWTAFDEAIRIFGDLDPIWQQARGRRLADPRRVSSRDCGRRSARAEVDHLHAHFASAAATVARLAAKIAGITYSLTAHAKDIFHEDVRPADLEAKLRDAAAVVTVSDFNRRYLKQTFGSSAARVDRIYNGLDLNEFRFASPARRPPQIVAVGRLVEKKGFGDLVDACDLLAGSAAGRLRAGSLAPANSKPSCRARIASHELGGTIEMLAPRPRLAK